VWREEALLLVLAVVAGVELELDPVLFLAEPRMMERMFWRGRRFETTFCFFIVFYF
jgi:hypothetical protein